MTDNTRYQCYVWPRIPTMVFIYKNTWQFSLSIPNEMNVDERLHRKIKLFHNTAIICKRKRFSYANLICYVKAKIYRETVGKPYVRE